MAIFYLCRHGQTEYNAEDKLQGWFDTPLTLEGVEEAHRAADKLKGIPIGTMYSSDIGRAFISAYIISRDIGYSGEIIRASELREVSFGDLSGLQTEVVAKFYHHLRNPGTYIPPHGEALVAMQRRVLKFVKRLAAENPENPILLVTHDCVINAFYADFAQLDFGSYNTDHTNDPRTVDRMELGLDGTITHFETL